MRFRYECTVRFDDLDSYGHVNNVTFAEYLQEARVAFAHQMLDAGAANVGYVVARQALDYRAPVGFRTDPLIVDMWVTRLGTTSFTAAYDVRDADPGSAPYVSAHTVIVAFDPQTERPRPLSERERKAITDYLEEVP
jgi:acyl-CoA thioester hydrolase